VGEIKFYKSIADAITDVVKELEAHTKTEYLRQEFSIIENKIDFNWPYADQLKQLTRQNVSMDSIIQKVCFPVLLTYDSSKFKDQTQACEEFKIKLIEEIKKYHAAFHKKVNDALSKQIVIHLILFPLKDKATLVSAMDNELRKLQ
jgi:hypothetical protein